MKLFLFILATVGTAFAGILAKMGAFVAESSNIGSVWLFLFDEPECPKSLIK